MGRRPAALKFSLDLLASRVDEMRASIPPDGLSLPAFEALALADVAPSRIHDAVRGLHNRRAIYVRRNRFDARVFSARPPRISGALRCLDSVDAFLASAVPHVRWFAESLAALKEAKRQDALVAAREARHDADAAAARIVKAVRSHIDRGMNLEDARQAMRLLFPAEVLRALIVFEPSFEPGSEASWNSVSPRKPRRIPNGLNDRDKILERIKRAEAGMTKTAIMRAIRPKLASSALDEILTALCIEGLIEERPPSRSDLRLGKRYLGLPIN